MNEGQVNLTPLQVEQQQRAQQEMADYWKTESSAMAAGLQLTKESPARSEMAAGAGAETGRVAGAQAEQQAAARSEAAGVAPDSGAFIARQGAAQNAGIALGTERATGGRVGERLNTSNLQSNLIGQGAGIVRQADSALNTAAQIQAAEYGANVQNKTQEMADFSNFMQQLSQQSGSMGSTGSAAGAAGGGGGG